MSRMILVTQTFGFATDNGFTNLFGFATDNGFMNSFGFVNDDDFTNFIGIAKFFGFTTFIGAGFETFFVTSFCAGFVTCCLVGAGFMTCFEAADTALETYFAVREVGTCGALRSLGDLYGLSASLWALRGCSDLCRLFNYLLGCRWWWWCVSVLPPGESLFDVSCSMNL